jgi:hypothetical protein
MQRQLTITEGRELLAARVRLWRVQEGLSALLEVRGCDALQNPLQNPLQTPLQTPLDPYEPLCTPLDPPVVTPLDPTGSL